MAYDRNSSIERQTKETHSGTDDQSGQEGKPRSANPLQPAGQTDRLLNTGERAILDVFRDYLMTPRKMLCLGPSHREKYEQQLAQLIDRGMLTEERFNGGYSLTEAGYAAMQACQMRP